MLARFALGPFCCVVAAMASADAVDVSGWGAFFTHEYDYVLSDANGLERRQEPVEITLSVAGNSKAIWENDIRVVRMESDSHGAVVPHQILGKTDAASSAGANGENSASARSANVIVMVDCPAHGTARYKLFWGPPKAGTARPDLHAAADVTGLRVTGDAPGLTVENEYYHIQLDPKSGSILTARLSGRPESENLFYGNIPIHFGVDVWSPPQHWDHDYDWASPPYQKLERGTLVTRYHRWGPLQNYRDVEVSITYTFYSHVPYVQVSSTMRFTADRAVRAVRMGEIVVAHSHGAPPNEKDADGKSPDLLSHYAWPDVNGSTQIVEIDTNRSKDGAANFPGVVPGALGILDRDVPWVAGYNTAKNYGIATLRKSQFAGNTLGGAVPQSAPCTYVSNYGWGFTYWSRPMVYPPGAKSTPEDQNTALAAGTFFAIDEALLFFKPDAELKEVSAAYDRFAHPLRHAFAGTGPW